MAKPIYPIPLINVSSKVFDFNAANKPSGKPIINANIIEKNTSSKVAEKRLASSSMTGCFVLIETPRSNKTRFYKNDIY